MYGYLYYNQVICDYKLTNVGYFRQSHKYIGHYSFHGHCRQEKSSTNNMKQTYSNRI